MTATSPDHTGLPYHRMARYSPHHRWWWPLLGTVVLVFGSVLATLFLYLLTEGIGTAAGYPELPDGGVDFGPVLGTGLDLAFIAVDLPLVLLAVLWLGRRPAGTVASVTGRPRWRWLAWCLLAAVPPMLLLPVVAIFLPDDQGDGGGAGVWVGWQTFLVSLAMLVVLVPLQSAAEEYVFRGWLLQAAGAFLRTPWLAVLPQAVLFAAAHGWGTPWGFADLLVFGVVAGLLTIRTGGLEASIALHALNNLLAFGLSAAYVDGLASDETAADATWQLALVDMASVLLFAAIVLWLARRRRPQNLSGPVPEPIPPHFLPYTSPQGAHGPYAQAPGAYGPYPQQAPGSYGPYPGPQGMYGPYPQQPGSHGAYPPPGAQGAYAPPPGAVWPYASPQGSHGPYAPPPSNGAVPGAAPSGPAGPGSAASGADAPSPAALGSTASSPVLPGDAPGPAAPGDLPGPVGASGAASGAAASGAAASGAAASSSAALGGAPGPAVPRTAAPGDAPGPVGASHATPGDLPGPDGASHATPGDAASPAAPRPAAAGDLPGPDGASQAAPGAMSGSAAPGGAPGPAVSRPAAPGSAVPGEGTSRAAPAPADPSSQQPGGSQVS
ncbi:type II CAAX prenyl endopeptidase Rce1 family protein [Streptomyces sp. NPDC006706]|uniref:CPBP family glutamic-type intramembrane protease n=1 Tax=Streptomyces sp. NPDC006706 TaxID=3364761 RepID=UPI0036C0A62F